MSQLENRVLHVKRLKFEKAKTNKYHKKEKYAYVAIDEYSSEFKDIIDESEVNVVELKQESPYVCKLLRPSYRKNLVKPNKNDKFSTKIYTFNITKCD